MPNVALAIEVAPDRVAAARWGRTGSLDGYAVESLPVGSLVPSAVEANIANSAAVEADETLISYMRQAPRESGIDVVTALARLRIIREYESLVEGIGLRPGVVMSSSLAAISLLEDEKPTLFARVSGSALTTAIVRRGVLCGYRCTELPAQGANLTPQMLLEEIFPVAAYYQDTWQETIQSVRVAGLGTRLPEFARPLENEFHCDVRSLLHSVVS